MSGSQAVMTGDGLVSGQWVPMAGWGRRVAAGLIDQLVYAVAYLPYYIGLIVILQGSQKSTMFAGSSLGLGSSEIQSMLVGIGLMLLGGAFGLAAFIWNRCIQQGRTGQSVGKSAVNIYLVSADTGKPIGAGTSFVREIVHVVDGLFYIGYLWPLWDPRKQTFADKIMGTVVAHAVPAPTPPVADADIPWSRPTDGGDEPGAFPRPVAQ